MSGNFGETGVNNRLRLIHREEPSIHTNSSSNSIIHNLHPSSVLTLITHTKEARDTGMGTSLLKITHTLKLPHQIARETHMHPSVARMRYMLKEHFILINNSNNNTLC